MQKPSILFLNRVYPPSRGASGRLLRELARSFAREGWQVSVIACGEKAKTDLDGSVRVIRVKGPQKPGFGISYIVTWFKILFAALRHTKPDLVVSMSDPPLLVQAGSIIAKSKKAKHIHWCQELYPDMLPAIGIRLPKFLSAFLHNLSRSGMERADRVIVVGRCMARRLKEEGFEKELTFIPNWADFELAKGIKKEGSDEDPQEEEEKFLRLFGEKKKNGRSYQDQIKHAPKFRVLYAGNIGRAHPLDTILDAAALLGGEHPEIEFIFVGDGPRHDEIASERAKRHLDNIRLIPYQPPRRLRDLMESGDIHLVTLKDEAAGCMVSTKAYSALMVGRPCILIGPNHNETAQLLRDYGAGSIVEQGNARQLADEILKYRLESDVWFKAHEGALTARKVFVPKESVVAWMERAAKLIGYNSGKGKP